MRLVPKSSATIKMRFRDWTGLRKIFGPRPVEHDLFGEVMASFDQVILALRCIRSGPVDFGVILVRSAVWNPIRTYLGLRRSLSSSVISFCELSAADSEVVVYDVTASLRACTPCCPWQPAGCCQPQLAQIRVIELSTPL